MKLDKTNENICKGRSTEMAVVQVSDAMATTRQMCVFNEQKQ